MIYVIAHKKFDDRFLNRDHYRILHVGSSADKAIDYLRDDTGDNISYKNRSYCELTGLYWIWKNGEERPDQITGLVHYRRFFTTYKENFLYNYFHMKPKTLDWSSIEAAVGKNNILLPACASTLDTVFRTYGRMHYAEDLRLTGRAIKKLSPDYWETFRKVMNSHKASYANIIVCRKKVLDEYCSWLFPILSYIDRCIDYSKYESDYQRRVIGFLGERLLDVWTQKNSYRIVRYPVFNTECPGMNIFSLTAMRIRSLYSLMRGGSLRV